MTSQETGGRWACRGGLGEGWRCLGGTVLPVRSRPDLRASWPQSHVSVVAEPGFAPGLQTSRDVLFSLPQPACRLRSRFRFMLEPPGPLFTHYWG